MGSRISASAVKNRRGGKCQDPSGEEKRARTARPKVVGGADDVRRTIRGSNGADLTRVLVKHSD